MMEPGDQLSGSGEGAWRLGGAVLRYGLLRGLLSVLLYGLLRGRVRGLLSGLVCGLVGGLFSGLVGGLLYGAFAGSQPINLSTRSRPNAGIRRSVTNGLVVLLAGGALLL